MAYIGKSPDGTGVRSRFYYTQSSGGGTSVTGSSDDGTTLTFSDGSYVDVYLNGVLLVAGTDYNTTTANTIAGLAALANGDVVEVVVYDIFTVADTVSALNGGTFNNDVTVRTDSTNTNATLTVEAAGSGNADADLKLLSDDTQSGRVRFFDGTGEGARIEYSHSGTNMTVQIEGSTRLRIDDNGDVKINDGNLVIGTAGHGIDFSATANSAGTMTNELLDDYEEGTWTPVMTASEGNNPASFSIGSNSYTKIGRLVFVSCVLGNINASGTTSTAQIRITGLPFTCNTANSYGAVTTDGISFQGSRTYLTTEVNTTNFIRFFQSGSGQSDSVLDYGDIDGSTSDIFFATSYITSE